MEIPSLKQLIDIKNNTIIEKVAEIKKVLYFIHPLIVSPIQHLQISILLILMIQVIPHLIPAQHTHHFLLNQ